MRRVVIASPFRGDRATNESYLVAAIRDCASRGEAPFAPHAIYPLAFDDEKADERALSIAMGCAWQGIASALVVYTDLGISEGMRHEIAHAGEMNLRVEVRSLPGWAEATRA